MSETAPTSDQGTPEVLSAGLNPASQVQPSVPEAPPAPAAPEIPADAAGYALAKPEAWPADVPFDDKGPALVAEIFRDLKVPKAMAGELWSKLMAADAARAKAALDGQAAEQAKLAASGKAAIDAEWGTKRPVQQDLALRTVHRFFSKPFADALTEGGPDAYPDLFIGLAKMAALLDEHRIASPAGGAPAAKPHLSLVQALASGSQEEISDVYSRFYGGRK